MSEGAEILQAHFVDYTRCQVIGRFGRGAIGAGSSGGGEIGEVLLKCAAGATNDEVDPQGQAHARWSRLHGTSRHQ